MSQPILKSIHVSDAILDDDTCTPYRLYNIQLQVNMEKIQDFTKPSPADKSWPSNQESELCEEIGRMINGALCRAYDPNLQLTDCEKFDIEIHDICKDLPATELKRFGWYLIAPR
jgi:hypothetical protein